MRRRAVGVRSPTVREGRLCHRALAYARASDTSDDAEEESIRMSTTSETTSVLQTTLNSVSGSAEFRRVLEDIKRGARVTSISGLVAGPARALVLAALQRETGRQFAVIAPAQRDLENWERDIDFWYCALRGVTETTDAVTVLPASESDPYAGGSPHTETLEKRALAL
ncbi:MAG: hypothetical protein QOK48_3050, partial [Blastocatellia bacterium]|nr:hypothetical protein [Blastocatellia bacterium]